MRTLSSVILVDTDNANEAQAVSLQGRCVCPRPLDDPLKTWRQKAMCIIVLGVVVVPAVVALAAVWRPLREGRPQQRGPQSSPAPAEALEAEALEAGPSSTPPPASAIVNESRPEISLPSCPAGTQPGTCACLGCQKKFVEGLSCQCNAGCVPRQNCCPDFREHCVRPEPDMLWQSEQMRLEMRRWAPKAPLRCKPTSSSVEDLGWNDDFGGWYDVQGCGRCHDYCRWVGESGSGGDPTEQLEHEASWWSCRLAGSVQTYTDRGLFSSWAFPRCSEEGDPSPATAPHEASMTPPHEAMIRMS